MSCKRVRQLRKELNICNLVTEHYLGQVNKSWRDGRRQEGRFENWEPATDFELQVSNLWDICEFFLTKSFLWALPPYKCIQWFYLPELWATWLWRYVSCNWVVSIKQRDIRTTFSIHCQFLVVLIDWLTSSQLSILCPKRTEDSSQ